MSKLETNQVDPATGTTLTLGTSGDTIAIPSGVTIANSGTATGFGGITSAQEFRLQADQAGSGAAGTVLTNWGENNTNYQAIGSAWSQSSGIFSCSSTGIYLCTFRIVILGASGNDAFDPSIAISTDSGGAYNTRATAWEYVGTTDTGASCGGTFMFDVATAGTFRLSFKQSVANDIGTTSTIKGDASQSETNIVFVRLADT